MLKKAGFTLLFVAAALTNTSFASTNRHVLQAGATLEYELPPNQPQLFTNYMFWPVEANCKITSEDSSDVLFVEALAKKGKINDIPLSKGQSTLVEVHPGENLKLNADSGAQVRITNEGQHTVRASCSS